MSYRQVGTSGLTVSVVGLGCNNFGRRCDLEQTRAVVEAALEQGITLLDTADTYGGGDSEGFLGRILKGRRDQVVLATKFGSHLGGLAAQLAVASVIAGATLPEQVRANVEAADWHPGPTTSSPWTPSSPRGSPTRS